ncbi:transcriptional regulator [Rhodoblastus sp.]|uniref:transcriptional regulator n=1 Tax=Rhodoblastus sp. TaxID=1962975 RepID=UPI003F9563E7
MTETVHLTPSRTDFVANARRAWGEALPDWIEALATAATVHSGVGVAKKLGISGSQVTQLINATYAGDIGGAEQRVRGALMGVEVDCPVLGEIGRHRCLDEQKKSFRGTSALRTRLFMACRGGCPHSRLKEVIHG